MNFKYINEKIQEIQFYIFYRQYLCADVALKELFNYLKTKY